MQTKKAAIRATIDAAALRMFAAGDFSRTGMSDIARAAGISVGNIYHYYGSKKELFYHLIPRPLVDKARRLLVEKVRSAHGLSIARAGHTEAIIARQEEFLTFLAENRLQMLIAFRHAEGTEYEGLGGETLALIERLVFDYLRSRRAGPTSALGRQKRQIIRVVYARLIEGTLDILEWNTSKQAIKTAFEEYLAYHFAGLAMLLEG